MISDTDSTRITSLRTIRNKLDEYIREKRYYATFNIELGADAESLLKVTVWQSPSMPLDEKAVEQGFSDYCDANNLEKSLVLVCFEEDVDADSSLITDPWTIREKLEGFIKEKGYNAGVSFIHEEQMDVMKMKKLLVSFGEVPISEMNRDQDAIVKEFGDFCIEKNLYDSLISYMFTAEIVVTSNETTSATTETTTTTVFAVPDETTTLPENSTAAAVTQISSDLPQTGNNTPARLLAVLSALITAGAGAALLALRRKEETM